MASQAGTCSVVYNEEKREEEGEPTSRIYGKSETVYPVEQESVI
jgi:hypothetical protein